MLLDAVHMEFSPRYHHTADMLLDEQMIIEAAKQNPEHFGPLYDKYYKQIFGYVYQRMDDKDTAFDLTAQVFLKALTNIQLNYFLTLSAPKLFKVVCDFILPLNRIKLSTCKPP